jgi:hypothetical protein
LGKFFEFIQGSTLKVKPDLCKAQSLLKFILEEELAIPLVFKNMHFNGYEFVVPP